MICKTVDEIIQSLDTLMLDLKLPNIDHVKKILTKIIRGKVQGKKMELRDPLRAIKAIQEIQSEAFYMVIDNDKTCRQEIGYFKMR